MREIHDLTLSLSRNLDRIEKTLSDRSRGFKEEFRRLETPDHAFGLRYTAIPISDDIQIERVYENGNLIPEFSWPYARVYRETNGEEVELKSLGNFHELGPTNWRPILRGARCEDEHGRAPEVQRHVYWEIHCSGLLECGFLSNNSISRLVGEGRADANIYPEVVVSAFAQVSAWANRLRKHAGNPAAEYTIQVEVTALGGDVIVQRDSGVWSMALGSIANGTVVFPTYSESGFEQAGELVELFENDFFNHIGQDLGEEQGKLRYVQ